MVLKAAKKNINFVKDNLCAYLFANKSSINELILFRKRYVRHKKLEEKVKVVLYTASVD